MRKGFSRRQFLSGAVKAGAAGAVAGAVPLKALAPKPARATEHEGVFTVAERATLDAALARMIPAETQDDWSAADLGAGDYIEQLLRRDGRIHAGGPTRDRFGEWQTPTRAKEMGWRDEIDRLREVYRTGLAELNRRAGGNFAARPPETQDLILQSMDMEGRDFFRALYAHTMEGVYGDPIYGGNKEHRAWNDLCYEGDVHGVRFPQSGPADAPWRVFGGYAPEEMASPGGCPEAQA